VLVNLLVAVIVYAKEENNYNLMSNIRCKTCGSKDFRADRALAGRLFCVRCGSPIGTKIFNSKNSSGKHIGFNTSLSLYIIIALVIFLIIINR